ncbi:MAG: ESPR-type extended signal peptide-containing protein, partial [Cytophagales bacterium]|nr:ESPR-type extended signal peptide-containing protein [Cytophagales bacterium]
MNCLAYRTIYNARRGCMMAVSETANSSGKASGESRPSRPSKSKTTTCRKARFNWATGSTGWQANHNVGCGLACLWGSFNSALSR